MSETTESQPQVAQRDNWVIAAVSIAAICLLGTIVAVGIGIRGGGEASADELAGAGQTGRASGPRDARRSGMPSMPGAAAPTVKQPVLSDDGAADSAAPEQKEEK